MPSGLSGKAVTRLERVLGISSVHQLKQVPVSVNLSIYRSEKLL